MNLPDRPAMAIAMATIYSALCSGVAFSAEETSTSDPSRQDAVRLAQATSTAPATSAASVDQLDTVQVTAKRLDAARNNLSPDTGSTIYRFDRDDIQTLPFGTATPLNQVILQSPGAVQDSYGQLHVRGDHSNLQYRINGVEIPEAISGFGQALDTRFADQINILTGALPAQYGYRTAGIVDIRTRGAGLETGGNVSGLGGSFGHGEGSAEYGGTSGAWTAYATASFLRDDVGIENPTSSRNAIHDITKQTKAFVYLSNVIDADTRISLIIGSSNGKFEIPDVPGQTPDYRIDGNQTVDSARLDARQNEKNAFEIVTFQSSPTDRLDYQLSLFTRHSDVAYQPDALGDLLFDGVASQIVRKNDALGLQGDASFRMNDQHTIRAGLFAQKERYVTGTQSTVFAADDDGNQTSTTPFTISDHNGLRGQTYGVYLQDEWQPTKALVVNYGGRFDHVATVTNEKQWSPRIGMTYDLTSTTRVHAGYARYFTPPSTEKIDTTTVTEFLGTTNALPSDANTAVKSERSNYFDAGISQVLFAGLTVGVDAYYRKVRNLQDEGQFGNALIFSDFNYRDGRIRGLEFSTSYRTPHWQAYANVAVAKAYGKDIVTGQFNFDADELAYIASHYVHLDHDQNLTVSAGTSYNVGPDARRSRPALRQRPAQRLREHRAPARVHTGQPERHPEHRARRPSARPTCVVAVINLLDRSFELRDGTGIGVGAPQYGPRRGYYRGSDEVFLTSPSGSASCRTPCSPPTSHRSASR